MVKLMEEGMEEGMEEVKEGERKAGRWEELSAATM